MISLCYIYIVYLRILHKDRNWQADLRASFLTHSTNKVTGSTKLELVVKSIVVPA